MFSIPSIHTEDTQSLNIITNKYETQRFRL